MTPKEIESAFDQLDQRIKGLQKVYNELKDRVTRLEDDLETLKRNPR